MHGGGYDGARGDGGEGVGFGEGEGDDGEVPIGVKMEVV